MYIYMCVVLIVFMYYIIALKDSRVKQSPAVFKNIYNFYNMLSSFVFFVYS